MTDVAEIQAAPSTLTQRLPELLVGLAVAAVAASALLLAFRSVPMHLLGYALASAVPFTLVASARRTATHREFDEGIPFSRLVETIAIAVLVGGLVLAVVHAYFIARRYG